MKHDTFNIGKKEHYLQGVLGEKQKLIMSAAISGVVTTLAIRAGEAGSIPVLS